jgi:hypothetical protein
MSYEISGKEFRDGRDLGKTPQNKILTSFPRKRESILLLGRTKKDQNGSPLARG